MWMGSGLTPVMYSGLEHLMPRMGMGMNNGQLQIPRVPMVDPAISPPLPNPTMWKSPVMNSFNVQHQMHNMSEAVAGYIGFQSMPLGQVCLSYFHSECAAFVMNSDCCLDHFGRL